jgi:hypothetical protein
MRGPFTNHIPLALCSDTNNSERRGHRQRETQGNLVASFTYQIACLAKRRVATHPADARQATPYTILTNL